MGPSTHNKPIESRSANSARLPFCVPRHTLANTRWAGSTSAHHTSLDNTRSAEVCGASTSNASRTRSGASQASIARSGPAPRAAKRWPWQLCAPIAFYGSLWQAARRIAPGGRGACLHLVFFCPLSARQSCAICLLLLFYCSCVAQSLPPTGCLEPLPRRSSSSVVLTWRLPRRLLRLSWRPARGQAWPWVVEHIFDGTKQKRRQLCREAARSTLAKHCGRKLAFSCGHEQREGSPGC